MRLFIAINPESSLKEAMFGATEPLRRALPSAKWVEAELIHMTVKFLGNRPESELPEIAKSLDKVAAGYRAIAYDVGGIGAFPNLRRPGVVWIGVQADAKLELINHDAEQAFAELGFPVEGRPFRPHITIGRVRESNATSLRSFAMASERFDYQAQSSVHSLDLMLSHHKDQRLHYTVLHSARLRGQ